MKNVIYKIESKRSRKKYVGSALNSCKRKSLHFRLLKQNKHHNIILQNHFNKYGIDDLRFIILEKDINKDVLIEREQYYIDTLKPEFNICKKAGSVMGRVLNDETKNKIRNSLIGKKHTEERRNNMRNAERCKRKPMTELHKKNISIGTKGCKKPPKTKLQIETARKNMIGNSYAKGEKYRNTAIIQFKDGIYISEFESIRVAAKQIGTTESNICHSLNGRTKKAKGYEWKYKKEFDAKP